MGLDMYLDRRSYVQRWDHIDADKQYEVTVKRGGKACPDIKPERVSYVIEQVAYWRRANAIHAWFVKHVQDGKDDCGHYYVSREQLQELKALCDKVLANSKLKAGKVNNGYTLSKKRGKLVKDPIVEDGEVIADPQIAETVLPTAQGFFFGGVEYDEWYYDSIKRTSETLAALLAEPEGGDFYYHSSW